MDSAGAHRTQRREQAANRSPQTRSPVRSSDRATGPSRSTSSHGLPLPESSSTLNHPFDHAVSDDAQAHTAPEPSGWEPRTCWICREDETEDSGQSMETWKTPCPCSLAAHEPCLLDWIGDKEAPKDGQATSIQKEITCPQCKAKIHLERPRSLIVDVAGRFEKLGGQLLLPTFVGGALYTLAIASSHHGAHTIRMIFGTHSADAILAPSPYESALEATLQRHMPILARPFFRGWRGWRVEFGLPVVPLALIASRTRLADSLLPLLPIAFFATHPDQASEISNPIWPPSAGMTFVILPYVRAFYEEFMERVWGEHERVWHKEIHSRVGRDSDADGYAHHEEEDGDLVQLEIDVEEEGPPEGQEEERRRLDRERRDRRFAEIWADRFGDRRMEAPPLQQPPQDREGDGGNAQGNGRQNGEDQQGQNGEQRQEGQEENGVRQHHHVNLDILTHATRIAETTIGALLFPTVSAFMGESIRLALPASWTVPGRSWGRPVATGLLQTRWGRSIIGGCLFVVMKDFLRIYCRWRMAQSFRDRKVLNYSKKLGKVIPTCEEEDFWFGGPNIF